jgi:hypothetical protein
MGISPYGAQYLLHAKSAGADFRALATIGRQGFYVEPRPLKKMLAAAGFPAKADAIRALREGAGGYAEPFFKLLGAERIDSFDASDFEAATFVHDMNRPIGAEFAGRYSTVLDSGTLEHVFNFPVAIENCMRMVAVGGCYIAITPANNWFGHGFYQFSPELYYTVFSEENGFEIVEMLAFEEVERPVWYVVRSPRELSERVTLMNSQPVYLCVMARRVREAEIFAQYPQQSDYVARWKPVERPAPVSHYAPPESRPLPIRLAKRVLPHEMRQSIRRTFDVRRLFKRPPPQQSRGFAPKYFERIGPTPGG